MSPSPNVDWSPDQMLEIQLKEPDSFLLVKETLERMGVPSGHKKKLYQSCHILHKRGFYYIVHFKELFALDGKDTNITENDIQRRNTIASMLESWKLLKIVKPLGEGDMVPRRDIKVIKHSDKDNWTLEAKYSIGNAKKPE